MKSRRLIVVIVLLLTSLILSSCSMVSGLMATETPVPTLTFTPTVTPSSTPTPIPTDTPVPTVTPLPEGRYVEVLGDGSFVYLDYDMQFGMVFPSTWYVVPFESEDEESASEKLVMVDASYADMLTALKPLMDFIAVKPADGDPTDADGVATGIALEGDVYAELALQDALDAQQVPEDAVVVFNEVTTNAAGVEMGLIEYEDSESHTVVCIFKTERGAMVISLASPTSRFESMSDELINIVNSIATGLE